MQLTPVSFLTNNDWIELNGGRRVSVELLEYDILSQVEQGGYKPAIKIDGIKTGVIINGQSCSSLEIGKEGAKIYWESNKKIFLTEVSGSSTTEYFGCWPPDDMKKYGTVDSNGNLVPEEGKYYEIDGVRYIGSGGTLVESGNTGGNYVTLTDDEVKELVNEIISK